MRFLTVYMYMHIVNAPIKLNSQHLTLRMILLLCIHVLTIMIICSESDYILVYQVQKFTPTSVSENVDNSSTQWVYNM